MLVIPIEQKLDSNNPPVITALLIIINFLVFFAYQQPNDNEVYSRSMEYYFESDLYEYENTVYQEYLFSGDLEQHDAYEQLEDQEKALWIIFDIGFAHYLEKEYFLNNPISPDWEDARIEFNAIVNELSAHKFGLIPADLNVFDFVASIFMHGNIGHLLGNMIFLFIFGFSLEVALGRLWFLSIYLIAGIGGDILTWITAPTSFIPTIGASGAVFGLLGMYLGLYGFKKIKFFFTVGFYANQFKAPALILLPYWALIELYAQFGEQDYIAHYAHLGGLLTGAIVVLIGKNTFIKVDRDYVEKVDTEAPFREKYETFLRQLDALNIPQAKQLLAELLLLKPGNLRLLKHQFDLLKLSPCSPEFEEIAATIFGRKNLLNKEAVMIARVVNEYDSLSQNHSAYEAGPCHNLFNLFLRAEHLEEAEFQLQKLREKPSAETKIPGMLLRLISYLNNHNQSMQANRYTKQLLEQYPDSEAADHIRAIRET